MRDLVVVGSGPGGHAAAISSALLGAKVTVIEKNGWGGTCTNRGCIPTKALLACSHSYAELAKSKRLGISIERASFEYPAIRRHQNQIVKTAALGARKSLADHGVELKAGTARVVSPGLVKIIENGEAIAAKNILIAWGSIPQIPSGIIISGLIADSDRFLETDRLPSSMAIIGGGAIGVEFATFLSQLGIKIYLIELLDRILPCEEPDCVDFLTKELGKLGVEIFTSARLLDISEFDQVVRLRFEKSGIMEKEVGRVLVCTGRSPSIDREQLDSLGVEYGERGIKTSPSFMTTVKGIYAVGDVTGPPLLAHRAAQQGKALASALYGDGSVKYEESAIPYITYTSPNIARVGLIESDARKIYTSLEITKLDYGSNMLARAELKAGGFGKLLFGKGRLVGATLVGAEAAELIASLSLAVACGLGRNDFKKWILAHPTLSEILNPF